MNQLLQIPAISSVASVPSFTSQSKSEMRQVMEMAPVYPDLRRPSASGQITEMTEYYSPAMTHVNGYHHASVELPSMVMGYAKPQSQAPMSRTLESAHSFPEHNHIHKPPSSGSISPEHVSPEEPDEQRFERNYKAYPHNQDSICSSSCSSPEFEQQAREVSLYLKNDPEVTKEEFDTYSPVEDGPDRSIYRELPPNHLDESYQTFRHTQATPDVRPPTNHQERHIDQGSIPSETTPRGGGKKTGSVKVSEKRRQQNRAAQRAMRERRKRAAQNQEVHMAAMVSENAYLRERVDYLSNLLLTHTTMHPAHIQQWDPYAHRTPQSFTPMSTANPSKPSSVADPCPQEASGPLPSIYSAHEHVHYSHPTHHEEFVNSYPERDHHMDHSSSNVRSMSGPSPSAEFIRHKLSAVSVMDGNTHDHPEWDGYNMGNVDHSERHIGSARTMECSSIPTSTVPSPTETEGHSIDNLPRVGH